MMNDDDDDDGVFNKVIKEEYVLRILLLIFVNY